MRKTIPLYWDPQDGTERVLIGSTQIDEVTYDIVSTVTDPKFIDRLGSPMLYATLGNMMPPGYKLASNAKISVHGSEAELNERIERLHGPGAVEALDAAIADGSIFSDSSRDDE